MDVPDLVQFGTSPGTGLLDERRSVGAEQDARARTKAIDSPVRTSESMDPIRALYNVI